MKEEAARRRILFEEALREAQARGKAPFDYDLFLSFYRQGSPSLPRPDELEYEYHVHYPDVLSMEGLARKQERYDEYQGGDLRWD